MLKHSQKLWKESDPAFMLAFVLVFVIAIFVFITGMFIIIHFAAKYW